jgi:hypothetical protein
MSCPNCGAQVPPDADYCPRCGRDLRPRGSFPWVACVLAFIAGALLCVVIGLVAGVGKTDTVTAHGAKHPPSTTTVTSKKRVTVSGPTRTVKGQSTTTTVTSTATATTTATTTTTVSTTKTVTGGG